MFKRCSHCKHTYPNTNFRRDRSRPTGLSNYCKPCLAKRDKEYQQQNRAKIQIKLRLWRKKQYAMVAGDYEALLDLYDSRCAICKTPAADLAKGLCIDHDHNTGDVRGLLCSSCNAALGFFRDDTKRLEAAIEYLR